MHRCTAQTDEAISCYQRALFYRPDWPEVQVTVAELYRSTQRPQRALATLDRMADKRSETQVPPRAYLSAPKLSTTWANGSRDYVLAQCHRALGSRPKRTAIRVCNAAAAPEIWSKPAYAWDAYCNTYPIMPRRNSYKRNLTACSTHPGDPKVPNFTVGHPTLGKELR